ncbi:hypothetical protein [Janthinobacterium sp. PSPC1-1]|uniref:hypothetical protein n=1 Tax=Janthinobacterium sp. PSPC1-1 TaxID=2804581 RepID=UPI003CF38A44
MHELHHARVNDGHILAERACAQPLGSAHRVRRLGTEFLLHQRYQMAMAMHAESKQGAHFITIIAQVLRRLFLARLLQLGAGQRQRPCEAKRIVCLSQTHGLFAHGHTLVHVLQRRDGRLEQARAIGDMGKQLRHGRIAQARQAAVRRRLGHQRFQLAAGLLEIGIAVGPGGGRHEGGGKADQAADAAQRRRNQKGHGIRRALLDN